VHRIGASIAAGRYAARKATDRIAQTVSRASRIQRVGRRVVTVVGRVGRAVVHGVRVALQAVGLGYRPRIGVAVGGGGRIGIVGRIASMSRIWRIHHGIVGGTAARLPGLPLE
jgi:hypothetical protein